jgi:hypothetical protein
MKNIPLFILLILNSYLVVSQNTDIIKFKPEYDTIADDSILNQLKSIPDSSILFYVDDSEFCIQFPGGDKAWMEYLKENFILPADVKDMQIEGSVCVSFTINEKGKVGNIKIDRSLCENIDAIVVKVISEMPDWIWNCKEIPRRQILIKRYQRFIL